MLDILYPKDILSRKELQKNSLNEKKKPDQQIQDFFNSHVRIQVDNESVLIIEEAEFLLQSVVIKLDDEFLGYLFKFVQSVTDGLETQALGKSIHEIFTSQYSERMNLLEHINVDRQKRQIYAITEQDEEEGSEMSETERRKS